MINRYALLAGLAFSLAGTAQAQCTLNPTVTPNNLILCPNAQDTIRTQAFGSYQWLKDGTPITGATSRTYVVEQFRDAGSMFSVIVTQGACTDTSAQVLVDGWAFTGLSVMTDGNFAIDPTDGHSVICQATALLPPDTLYFEVMQPYVTHVRWSRNGQLLPDTTTRIRVTASGTYDVVGAPAVCPNFINHSLPLDVEFRAPAVPAVAQVGNQLHASDPQAGGLFNWKWMVNDTLIPGATGPDYAPPAEGTYRVQAEDQFCYTFSDTIHFVPQVAAVRPGAGKVVRLYPNPTSGQVQLEADRPVNVAVLSATGVIVLEAKGTRSFDAALLPEGVYSVRLSDGEGRLIGTEKLVRMR